MDRITVARHLSAYPVSAWKVSGSADWINCEARGQAISGGWQCNSGHVHFSCINSQNAQIDVIVSQHNYRNICSYHFDVKVDGVKIFEERDYGDYIKRHAIWYALSPVYEVYRSRYSSEKASRLRAAEHKL